MPRHLTTAGPGREASERDAGAGCRPPGRELLDRLAGRAGQPGARALELARTLRGRDPPDLVAAALTQQALRVAARDKFSRADQMLSTRAGVSTGVLGDHGRARRRPLPVGPLGRRGAAWSVAEPRRDLGGNLIALGAGRRLALQSRPGDPGLSPGTNAGGLHGQPVAPGWWSPPMWPRFRWPG